MLTKDLKICNKLGLHTRASVKLIKLANRFISDITLSVRDKNGDDKTVTAKSIMGVMLLAASKDTVITVTINGPDKKEAMAAIETYINNKCDEE